MRFKLDLKADGGNITNATNTTIINASHSLIKHMIVRSGGKIIYDTDNLHLVTFIKILLEYSDDYSRSVAKNSLWYLDTTGTHVVDDNTGFAARRLGNLSTRRFWGNGDVSKQVGLDKRVPSFAPKSKLKERVFLRRQPIRDLPRKLEKTFCEKCLFVKQERCCY